MTTALVIIDMQPEFTAAKNVEVLFACKKAIKDSIKREEEIIFIEYDGAGKTDPQLTNICEFNSYKYRTVIKQSTDGSSVLVPKLLGLRAKNVKICGIETDVCVSKTVLHTKLRLKKTKIVLLSEACGGLTIGRHNFGLNHLKWSLEKDTSFAIR